MPYAANVYTLPPGTAATTLTPIDSSDYNAFIADIEAAQNAARPVVAGGTGGNSVITGWDGLAAKGTDIADGATINLTTATGPSITMLGTTTLTGVTLAEGSIRLVRAAAAKTITASANLLCNGSASVNMSVAAEDLLIFRGGAGGVVSVAKLGGSSAASSTALTAVNLGFAVSVAGNALTIALKGADGNDPSASNPVVIPFRNVTAATGTLTYLTITSALSLVISSGSTMGFASGVLGKLWWGIFNDAGTPRIGAVNCLSGTSIMALADGIYSSTAEGGAGAADSAQVIYTGTAVTAKAFTVCGSFEATEATAGTWATAPSLLTVRTPSTPLPGTVVQARRTDTGAVATGTTLVPYDDTSPQNTEGDQYMTQAITPTSAANVLSVMAQAQFANTVSSNSLITSLFQDSVASALKTVNTQVPVSNLELPVFLSVRLLAGTTSSTTFKVRSGASNASTTTFNGAAGGRLFGGGLNSFMQVEEIIA